MKVNDEVHILQVPMTAGDAASIMNISLIVDPTHGLTLVDTGLPTFADLIEEAIVAEGFSLSDIRQIVITHQDLDHVGALHQLKERTGASVFAYAEEIPFIDGRITPIKWPTAGRLAQSPAMAERLKHYQSTEVDIAVRDGDVLERSANAQVIATPGHTPGHMSLYLPVTKTLIAGDAMISSDGVLGGPMERATPDMDLALQSVRKFLDLDIDNIVCYHGGIVTDDIQRQLHRVVA